MVGLSGPYPIVALLASLDREQVGPGIRDEPLARRLTPLLTVTVGFQIGFPSAVVCENLRVVGLHDIVQGLSCYQPLTKDFRLGVTGGLLLLVVHATYL